MSQLLASFRAYASRFAKEVSRKDVRVAVFPFEDTDAALTALSDQLANTLSSALSESGFIVVERAKFGSIIQERDLKQSFGSGANAKILDADYLFFGKYFLTGGKISVGAKAVEVNTSRNLCPLLPQDCTVLADKSIRALAFTKQGPLSAESNPPPSDKVWEEDGFVMVVARYKDVRADQFHLLDRVRQRVRERLFSYAKKVLLVDPSFDLEEWYKKGEETDCKFEEGSVELTMKFKIIGGKGP